MRRPPNCVDADAENNGRGKDMSPFLLIGRRTVMEDQKETRMKKGTAMLAAVATMVMSLALTGCGAKLARLHRECK